MRSIEHSMRERDDEDLAVEQVAPAPTPAVERIPSTPALDREGGWGY